MPIPRIRNSFPAGSQGSSYADRALQGVDYHQFAPRFGFAYSLPDNKTVLRGGYGIFYSNLTTAGGMQSMEINPPNHLRVNLTTSPTNPTLFLNQGFPAGALSPADAKNVELVSYDTERRLAHGAGVELQYPARAAGRHPFRDRLLRQQARPHVAAIRRQPRAARAGQRERQPPLHFGAGAGHHGH